MQAQFTPTPATRLQITSRGCQPLRVTILAKSTSSSSCCCDAPQPRPSSSRRSVLLSTPLIAGSALIAAQPSLARGDAGDWSSPGLATPVDESAPKFSKTESGIRIQELANGSGPQAQTGSTVLFDYVLRRSNGYFIYGTLEGVSFQPKDVPVGPISAKLGDGTLIPGLEEVLAGMRPGAKRRALIPPAVGYTSMTLAPLPPTFATKRQLEVHRNEPLLFEVQLLRVDGAKA